MKKTTFKETAYQYVREHIVSGKWVPGDIVEEKEIASSLGVSRTPVHEAIAQLAEEGLISIMPRRGTIVAHISIADIRNVYEVRRLVEEHTIGLAVKCADRDRLLEFKRVFESDETLKKEQEDWDGNFHRYLAECTKNKYLIKIVSELMVQSMRIRSLSNRRVDERRTQSVLEHIAIIDAILDGDEELAKKEIINHLNRSEEGYKNIFSETSYFSI